MCHVVEKPTRLIDTQDTLDHSEVMAVVRVLPGFAADLARGREVPVQVLVDGSNSNTANIVAGPIHDNHPDDTTSTAVLTLDADGPGGSEQSELPRTGADFANWLLLGLTFLTIGVAVRFGAGYRRG